MSESERSKQQLEAIEAAKNEQKLFLMYEAMMRVQQELGQSVVLGRGRIYTDISQMKSGNVFPSVWDMWKNIVERNLAPGSHVKFGDDKRVVVGINASGTLNLGKDNKAVVPNFCEVLTAKTIQNYLLENNIILD